MTCGKERRKVSATFRVCVARDWLSKFSRNPSPPVCRRGCTVSPEKGGALRNQSTGGRRLGVAAVICGALFGAPLLLLQNADGATRHDRRRRRAACTRAHEVVHPASHLDGVNLPSHLVAYQRRRRRPRRRHRRADDHDDGAADHDDTTAPPPPPTTTTTTTATATADHDDHRRRAPPRRRTPRAARRRGTRRPRRVLRQPDASLRDGAHGGQRRHRRVDRRARSTTARGPGYPRVVDMSPEGFSQIADLGQGVVDVTISW